jgi:NADPH-dependent F420 reductase
MEFLAQTHCPAEAGGGNFVYQNRRDMNTKQTIAIIGATGQMGTGISKSLAGGNYRLLLLGNQRHRLEALNAEIIRENTSADIEIAECPKEASWEADIIILAVPYAAQAAIAAQIREVANQKIVISIANPLNEKYDGLVTASDTSAAEQLQSLLPHSKVVKAFNTVFAADFGRPVMAGQRADVFVAGNDEDALRRVHELVETAGFNPIIAGQLHVSRTLESMALLLIQLNMKYNDSWWAGWKVLHQQPVEKTEPQQ